MNNCQILLSMQIYQTLPGNLNLQPHERRASNLPLRYSALLAHVGRNRYCKGATGVGRD